MTSINFENFNQKDFIQDVRAFMRKNAISIRKFAKMAAISPATLVRIETGENDMTIGMGVKIQKAMRLFKPDGA